MLHTPGRSSRISVARLDAVALAALILAASCTNDGLVVPLGQPVDMAPDLVADAGPVAPSPCRADADCPRGRCDAGRCAPLAEHTLAFGPAHCTVVGGMMAAVSAPAAGDFDHNGTVDVVLARSEGVSGMTSLVFERGKGNGEFVEGGAQPTALRGLTTIDAADLDGDGQLDLLIDESLTGTTAWRGHGDGTFDPPVVLVGPNTSSQGVRAVADWNRDGRADFARVVLSMRFYQPEVWLSSKLGGGGLGYAGPASFDRSVRLDVRGADLDGDHRIDLLAVRSTDGQAFTLQSFLSVSDGSFRASAMITAPETGRWPDAVDLNRDGRADLVYFGSKNAGPVSADRIYPGRGDGTFGGAIDPAGDPGVEIHPGAFADFDGDGTQDLAWCPGPVPAMEVVHVNRGWGDGTFRAPLDFPNVDANGGVPGVRDHLTAPRAADLDGDGRVDLWSVNGGFEWTVLCTMLNQSK